MKFYYHTAIKEAEADISSKQYDVWTRKHFIKQQGSNASELY